MFYFRIGSELTAKLDLDVFFETLSNPFAGAVQYNRDSRPNSAYNIKHVCSYMAGDSLTPEQAMQALANLVLVGQPDQPMDWSYAGQIQLYRQTQYTLDGKEFSASECTSRTLTCVSCLSRVPRVPLITHMNPVCSAPVDLPNLQ